MKINEIEQVSPVQSLGAFLRLNNDQDLIQKNIKSPDQNQDKYYYSFYRRPQSSTYVVVLLDQHSQPLAVAEGQVADRKFYVQTLEVDTQHRGQGLALYLYQIIIQKLELALVSDKLQTSGSKAVWRKLIQGAVPGITVKGLAFLPSSDQIQLLGAQKISRNFYEFPVTVHNEEIVSDGSTPVPVIGSKNLSLLATSTSK